METGSKWSSDRIKCADMPWFFYSAQFYYFLREVKEMKLRTKRVV
jgi:hypothetical protein